MVKVQGLIYVYRFLGFLVLFKVARLSETFAPPKVSDTSKGGLREGGA